MADTHCDYEEYNVIGTVSNMTHFCFHRESIHYNNMHTLEILLVIEQPINGKLLHFCQNSLF